MIANIMVQLIKNPVDIDSPRGYVISAASTMLTSVKEIVANPKKKLTTAQSQMPKGNEIKGITLHNVGDQLDQEQDCQKKCEN